MNKIAILVILIVNISIVNISCVRTDRKAAQKSAEEFRKHLAGSSGVLCTDTDTDGDGYISCTVFMHNADPIQIQCGSEMWCIVNCARGCKYQPAMKLSK